ncbi:MAG: type IV pilus inner membrane component PilO [Coriobacteriia bacterium]
MNRLSARNQLILAIVAIVLIAVAVVFLAIMPAFERATMLNGQISQAQSEIQAEKAVLARRQSAKAQSADNQVALLKLANQVPESPELPTLIVDLQDTANAAGLDFVQLQPGEMEPAVDVSGLPAGYSTLGITMSVRGEWADQIEFLRKIDKLSRGVRVTSVGYSYEPETDETDPAVVATIEIEVYTMSIIQTSASPSTPATVAPPASATPSQ